MGSWLHLFLAWNHMQSSGLRNPGLDRPGTLPAIWFPLNFPMSWVGWVYNYVFFLGGCLVLFSSLILFWYFQLDFWINFFISNPISCHCPLFLNGDWHWSCHWSSALPIIDAAIGRLLFLSSVSVLADRWNCVFGCYLGRLYGLIGYKILNPRDLMHSVICW